MKEEQNNIENLMVRYMNNECSDDENKELLTWINQSGQNKNDFIALKDIWDASRKMPGCEDDQLALFYKGLYFKSRKSRIILMQRAIAVAAVLLVVLAIALFMPHSSVQPVEGLQVFTVPLGSRSSVMLADGTVVNLNSGSELSYSNNFSNQNRSVSLTGEAFFQVKKDAEHPFVVKTDKFDINVTGTQFNVCAYSEDNFTTTTLVEGKINLQIHNIAKTVDINPGEKFSFDSNSRKYSMSATDVEQEIAWKNGEFIFKKIRFSDLTKRLERWYDVKLICTGEQLSSLVYSGRFKNQESIWQVLDALKLTSPINYKRKSLREFEIFYNPHN